MRDEKAIPEWIPVARGCQIEGSANTELFNQWVKRWNRRPDTEHKIMRRHGKVELNSLKAALDEDARKFDNDGEKTDAALDALYLSNLRRSSSRGNTGKGAHH